LEVEELEMGVTSELVELMLDFCSAMVLFWKILLLAHNGCNFEASDVDNLVEIGVELKRGEFVSLVFGEIV
jgi:hypothetical protein